MGHVQGGLCSRGQVEVGLRSRRVTCTSKGGMSKGIKFKGDHN